MTAFNHSGSSRPIARQPGRTRYEPEPHRPRLRVEGRATGRGVTPLVRHPVVSVRHNRVLTLGQHKVLAWTRGLSLAAVAWGALAFGGVYPWAYWPLALVCAVAGVLGLSATTAASPAVPRTLSISLALLGTAVLLQLVPLPLPALSFITRAAS